MTSGILKDQAYEAIKQRLLRGEITPGSRIREDLIASELSVSRTPVREAINQLHKAGFVEIVPRHGIFAATITKETLLELTRVREALAVLAVKACCERIMPEEIGELENLLRLYEEACDRQDLHERSICDGMYHKRIAEYSGNGILYSYLSDIEDMAMYSRNMVNYSFFRTDSRRVHREILEGIRNRNPEAAMEAMRRNINHLYESMGSVLK